MISLCITYALRTHSFPTVIKRQNKSVQIVQLLIITMHIFQSRGKTYKSCTAMGFAIPKHADQRVQMCSGVLSLSTSIVFYVSLLSIVFLPLPLQMRETVFLELVTNITNLCWHHTSTTARRYEMSRFKNDQTKMYYKRSNANSDVLHFKINCGLHYFLLSFSNISFTLPKSKVC